MIPDHVLSSQVVPGYYLTPDNRDPYPFIDYEYGGIALNDPSEGLHYQIWKAHLRVGVNDIGNIWISAPNHPETVAYTGVGLTEISLTFDQNMNLFFAFMQNGEAKFRWFDPTISEYVITTLPAGTDAPKCTLDDKRDLLVGTSDIILTYTRAGVMYAREQRDRYEIEYELASGVVGQVLIVGMTSVNRLQWAVGLMDTPVGQVIYRGTVTGSRRGTTQGNSRKVVGTRYG